MKYLTSTMCIFFASNPNFRPTFYKFLRILCLYTPTQHILMYLLFVKLKIFYSNLMFYVYLKGLIMELKFRDDFSSSKGGTTFYKLIRDPVILT